MPPYIYGASYFDPIPCIFGALLRQKGVSMKSPCEERVALLVEYQRLTQAYSVAIGNMAVRQMSPNQYLQLCVTAEKARQASMGAREKLNRHIAEHGC